MLDAWYFIACLTSRVSCPILVQAAALERDTWRQQYEDLRDRKLRDSGQVESQAQVRRCKCPSLTLTMQGVIAH